MTFLISRWELMVCDTKRYCGIQPFFLIPHFSVTFSAKVLILLGFWVYLHPSRGVAQPGSASALGAEGRRFESVHPDQPNLVL